MRSVVSKNVETIGFSPKLLCHLIVIFKSLSDHYRSEIIWWRCTREANAASIPEDRHARKFCTGIRPL